MGDPREGELGGGAADKDGAKPHDADIFGRADDFELARELSALIDLAECLRGARLLRASRHYDEHPGLA